MKKAIATSVLLSLVLIAIAVRPNEDVKGPVMRPTSSICVILDAYGAAVDEAEAAYDAAERKYRAAIAVAEQIRDKKIAKAKRVAVHELKREWTKTRGLPDPSKAIGFAKEIYRLDQKNKDAIEFLISQKIDPETVEIPGAFEAAWSKRSEPDREKTIAFLVEKLKSDDPNWRRIAASNLGKIGTEGNKKAVHALVEALKDKDRRVRRLAINALGEIGPAAAPAVPVLIEHDMFRIAIDTLGRIGPAAQAAVPALIKTLKDEDSYTRWRAIRALGRIGPSAGAAIPALQKAVKDDDKNVRDMAREALRRIQVAPRTIHSTTRDNG